MKISLFDTSVKSYLQVIDAAAGFMNKCAGHCAQHGPEADELVEARLYPDMFPFHFQIVSVVHHSIGAINGMIAGEFAPPKGIEKTNFAGLHAKILQTKDELDALSPDTVNALSGGQTIFKLGETDLPFTNENFVLSFSLPNFYFHATTAYDILRQAGIPLGKRDYLGQLRIGVS